MRDHASFPNRASPSKNPFSVHCRNNHQRQNLIKVAMVPSTTPIAANSHFHSSHQGLTSWRKVMIAREGFGRFLGLPTQPRPSNFSSCAFWTILGSCLG